MHKKLAMGHQMGRALTAQDPAYKRLLEKAVDEQIEQGASRLEQLSKLKSKDRNPDIMGEDPDEQQILGKNNAAPKPRKPVRSKSRPQREGQMWLESWNNGIETATERSKDPPAVGLFLETTEAILMKTEVECFDLIDRIGNEFDIDTSLFLMQATHWHERAEDNYGSTKEAVQRHAGEGGAVLEALFDETDCMYGNTDGQARVICHDHRELIKSKRLKSKKDIICAPKPIIKKKKLIPDKDTKGKMKFQRMRVRLTSPGHRMREYLHYDPNRTAAPVMHHFVPIYTCLALHAQLRDLGPRPEIQSRSGQVMGPVRFLCAPPPSLFSSDLFDLRSTSSNFTPHYRPTSDAKFPA
jgi:hypothetical protein